MRGKCKSLRWGCRSGSSPSNLQRSRALVGWRRRSCKSCVSWGGSNGGEAWQNLGNDWAAWGGGRRGYKYPPSKSSRWEKSGAGLSGVSEGRIIRLPWKIRPGGKSGQKSGKKSGPCPGYHRQKVLSRFWGADILQISGPDYPVWWKFFCFLLSYFSTQDTHIHVYISSLHHFIKH